MPAPTIHVAHSSPAPVEPKWYAAPLTGIQHAFRGIRAVCSASWWTAAWSIVGPIEAVDRSRACADCLALTGSTEAELAGQFGDR